MEGTAPSGHLDMNLKKKRSIQLLMVGWLTHHREISFNANSFNLRMKYSSLYKVKVYRKLSFNRTENSAPVHCTWCLIACIIAMVWKYRERNSTEKENADHCAFYWCIIKLIHNYIIMFPQIDGSSVSQSMLSKHPLFSSARKPK